MRLLTCHAAAPCGRWRCWPARYISFRGSAGNDALLPQLQQLRVYVHYRARLDYIAESSAYDIGGLGEKGVWAEPTGTFRLVVKSVGPAGAVVELEFLHSCLDTMANTCRFLEDGAACIVPGSKAALNYCVDEVCTVALVPTQDGKQHVPTLCGAILTLKTHDPSTATAASQFLGDWVYAKGKVCNDHSVYAHHTGRYELRVNTARSKYDYQPRTWQIYDACSTCDTVAHFAGSTLQVAHPQQLAGAGNTIRLAWQGAGTPALLFFAGLDTCRDYDGDGFASRADGGSDCDDTSAAANRDAQGPSEQCLHRDQPYGPCQGPVGRVSYCDGCDGCSCNVCVPVPTQRANLQRCPRFLEIVDVENFDAFFTGVYVRNDAKLVNGRATYYHQSAPDYEIQHYSSKCTHDFNDQHEGKWVVTQASLHGRGHVYFAFAADVTDALLLPEATGLIHYWDHQDQHPRTARFASRGCADADNDGLGRHEDGGLDCDDSDPSLGLAGADGACVVASTTTSSSTSSTGHSASMPGTPGNGTGTGTSPGVCRGEARARRGQRRDRRLRSDATCSPALVAN